MWEKGAGPFTGRVASATGAEASLRQIVAVFLHWLDHRIEGRGRRGHVLTARATVTVAAGAGATVAVAATEATTVSPAIATASPAVAATITTGAWATGRSARLGVGGIERGV